MAASNGISITCHYSRFYAHFLLLIPNPTVFLPSRAPIRPHRGSKPATASSRSQSPITPGRRWINFSIVGLMSSKLFSSSSQVYAVEDQELGRYTDSNEGFTLLVPSSWIKVDKAGATVLFEDPIQKSNNLGVVVSPTRISDLAEFGTLQFVADKLIQAERRKESTLGAELMSVRERWSGDEGMEGVRVYEFEYSVESRRGGSKRVFSGAFAKSKKLYLLNISISDSDDDDDDDGIAIEKKKPNNDNRRRSLLGRVLHSFQPIPIPQPL